MKTIDTVEKTCSRCCLTKPASEFGKNKSNKEGLQSWFKNCKREHYESNKDAALEWQRQYNEAHRDQVLEGKRRWHQANKDALNERARRYRADNADAIREGARRRYGEGGRPADKPWPERPIAYSTAHARVKATYGAASNHPCILCGEQAHAWSYDHSDPTPLMHQGVGLWANKPPIPYSADPERYDPMCRSCHVKRDSYGAA